jgi:hypothetical protein
LFGGGGFGEHTREGSKSSYEIMAFVELESASFGQKRIEFKQN